MTERAVAGTGKMEMGNQSMGTESVVSIAFASPFDERNISTSLSYHNGSNWCASTGKPESTASNARTSRVLESAVR
jgi:hypothetical protein